MSLSDPRMASHPVRTNRMRTEISIYFSKGIDKSIKSTTKTYPTVLETEIAERVTVFLCGGTRYTGD